MTIVLCLMYFSYIVGHCLYDILNKIIWNHHSDFCSVTIVYGGNLTPDIWVYSFYTQTSHNKLLSKSTNGMYVPVNGTLHHRSIKL